jgi:CHASE3 domain sensor protein
MIKIRYKIITGFVILGIMLVISGLISIYELTKLGNQVNRLLMDNYRSIDFSKQMNNS